MRAVQDAALDPRMRAAWERLRLVLLARLALGPASLHEVYLDVYRLVGEGVLPALPSLAEVVEELGLYERLGLVSRCDGALCLVWEKLPGDIAWEVEALAAELAERLGAWSVAEAAAGELVVA